MTKRTFWTFERGGETFDGEFPSRQSALDYACEQFRFDCDEQYPQNGDEFQEAVTLIRILYDDEFGTSEEIKHEEAILDYTYYHGDLKEHGTW